MAKRKLLLANNPLLSGPSLDERAKGTIPYRELSLDSIERDPNQPRVNFDEEKLQELAQSIRTYGVLNPILVKQSKSSGRYKLIAGERRYRASQLVGLTSIPAIIDQEIDSGTDRILAMQLVENLQRSDLTPLERAHAIGALKEAHKLTVREIGEKLGISKSMVQRSLDILDLPDDLLNALREGASESKILLLAQIEDEEMRGSYLKDLDTLTRNQLKRDLDSKEANDDDKAKLSPEDQRIVDEIQRSLGLRVKMIKPDADAEKGRLSVEFYSGEDLQLLFRRLVNEA